MTDEMMTAVREVRREAEKLRLVCIAAAKTRALLHIAYDPSIVAGLSTDEAVLLARLGGVH